MAGTHTTAYIFDQTKVGAVETAVEALREEWDHRSEFISSARAVEEGEKRLQILEGVTGLLRDDV